MSDYDYDYDFDFMPEDVWFVESQAPQTMQVVVDEDGYPHVIFGPDGECLGRERRRIGFEL